MSNRGVGTSRRGHAWRRLTEWLTPRRRFGLAVFIPIAISIFSQFGFVQESTCVLAKLPLGIGRCNVMADLIAPAWALAIIPVANRLRAAAARFGTPAENSESWLATRLATRQFAELSVRAAKWGVALIILLSYTREWERFGERPDVVWYVLLILVTFAMLAVAVWWIRDELHRRGASYLSRGRLPASVNAFLMDDSDGRPRRAPHVVAFALITGVVALVILGQLDSLLRGMHQPGSPSVGLGGLASIEEFDLSKKPAMIVERVASWRAYTEAVGAQYGSARSVVTAHVILDTVATIPAYVAIGFCFATYAWRQRLTYAFESAERRTYELITLAGLVLLLATAALDVGKNILTWQVMDAAWSHQESSSANVRLFWFFALGRTIGLWALGAASLLLLALWDTPLRRFRRALVAVRSEILLLALFGLVVLMLPQTADVIRGWRVSHTVITVGLAVVLSMLLRWTSVSNLRLRQGHWEQVQEGDPPVPPRMRVLSMSTHPTMGRFAAAAIVVAAALQLALFKLPVGRGLVVPAIFIIVLWVSGLALPPAPYVRGNHPVDTEIRRRVPRALGAAVYLIIGIAVIKAAASTVAYTPDGNWWLVIALIPPALGIWRIVTRTTETMGSLEAGFAAVLLLLAMTLFSTGDDPGLPSPALAFAGVTFSYGSLAFFNSYERTSLVSRISHQYLSPRWAKPFAIGGGVTVVATILWFYLDPIALAPRIGTIGMIVMAMMVFTLVGAGAVRFAELTRPPRILAAFGIKRTPVVVLLMLWLLLAPVVVDQGVNDIRVIPATTGEAVANVIPGGSGGSSGLGFADVWDRWEAANLGPSAAAPDSERPVIPLVLVSSSGGGLRAAAWTSLVLDCVFEGAATSTGPCAGERTGAPPIHRVALMSGVSGGSLGMAEYVAHLLDPAAGEGDPNTWVDEVLGDDYLAASIGWLFFVDLPRSLIGFGTEIRNRAEVTEQTWEASWPEGSRGLQWGLTELWATNAPPLIFNGTSVNDGCRVNISALDVDGGSPEVPSCSGSDSSQMTDGGVLGATHDLTDLLCPGDDVALSTAAGLSARFPVVSVAGRIASDQNQSCQSKKAGAIFVVDGGYLEGSGAGTLLDAWEALAGHVEDYNTSDHGACVVPFMLHIDNGYESPSITANRAVPREFAVPLLATMNSSSGITAARAEAALAFEHPFTVAGRPVDIRLEAAEGGVEVTGRYARLVTRAHPGVQAPLGWTLSAESFDDLRSQLAIIENQNALKEIRTWLDGDMICTGD